MQRLGVPAAGSALQSTTPLVPFTILLTSGILAFAVRARADDAQSRARRKSEVGASICLLQNHRTQDEIYEKCNRDTANRVDRSLDNHTDSSGNCDAGANQQLTSRANHHDRAREHQCNAFFQGRVAISDRGHRAME